MADGYIQQRGRRFRAVAQVDGRRHSATFDYRHEAQRWIDEHEARRRSAVAEQAAEVAAAPAPVGASQAVAVYAAGWLRRVAPTKCIATGRNYRLGVQAIAESAFGAVALEHLRPSHVEDWVADLQASGMGAASIHGRYRVLRMVLNSAKRERLIGDVVTFKVGLPTLPKKQARVIKPREDEALLAATEGDPALRAMLLLGLDGALRWGEVAGLTGEAIEWEWGPFGRIHVHQVVDTAGRAVRPYTKGHDDRQVMILTARLREALEAVQTEGLLFTNTAGNFLDRTAWYRQTWQPMVRASGLVKPPGFHDLRHSAITRLGNNGMPPRLLQAFAGHAHIETTMGYCHAADDDVIAAAGIAALAAAQAREAARAA